MTTHIRARALLVMAVLVAALIGLPSSTLAQGDADREYVDRLFAEGAAESSGAGKRIGYISLGEAEDFVARVTEGIRKQARIAGVELVFCDSNFNDQEALICARQMASLGLDGILNYQLFEAEAGRICTAHGNLPTIAIDIHQQPCERSFAGVDNRRAGLMTGIAVGEYLERERDCAYDTVFVLHSPATGRVDADRTGGMVDGFAGICGPVPGDKLRDLDVDGYELALEAMSAELLEVPVDGVHVILSINTGAGSGAAAAAESLGRVGELRIGTQGAEVVKREVACEDHWIAATAYFPERYGHIVIPAMIDLLDGEDIPEDLFIPHVSVTAESITEIYDDAPDCSAGG